METPDKQCVVCGEWTPTGAGITFASGRYCSSCYINQDPTTIKTYSMDVSVRVVVEAETQTKAEIKFLGMFENHLFSQFPNAEYYNLQSREGSWSALYVGESTDDTDVWRPTTEKETQ